MNVWDEFLERVRKTKARELGPLSIAAGVELDDAISKEPERFISTPEDRAFYMFAQLMDSLTPLQDSFEDLDDDVFCQKRKSWLTSIHNSCSKILDVDQHCTDAKTLQIISLDYASEKNFEALESHAVQSLSSKFITDAWDNIYARPSLRARAATSRAMLETARYSQAVRACETLISSDPADHVGARYTLSLAYARLELEEKLEALESSYRHRSNAWFALARIILLYKLDRMSAARRALQGFMRAYRPGPFLLMHPVYVELYLLVRPAFEQGSFEEVAMACMEAEPILMDTPDLIIWAQEQDGFVEQAKNFAFDNGFEW
ncbi:hypothetical protein [Atopobium fossor]|uniref:hypothetical protein n=1 Tax=Atopobium fossor TaxID=39487 RepID=UPI00040045E5|nr:hypothetical protein [Atopobium fossor]